jgi:Spy/CpxP family protein refolding chaperone
MQIIRNLKRLTLAAAIVLPVLAVSPARAQFGEAAGIAEAMTADYFRRDIVLFQQGLNLDDAQRDIIDALYSDYEQEFEAGLARMRQRIEDMREELQSQDVDRVLRIVFKPIEEWSVEKRGLGNQFLENVKVVLTPEQQEQWPKFERFLFREKHLSKGTLSGESLNLFHVVRDMQLTEPQNVQVQQVMDMYDVELDEALRNRQRALIGDQRDMLKSFSEQNSAVSLAILQRQIDMKVAVRGVNDRYIALVTEAMPQDRQHEFRQKALERAYPRIYRPNPVQNIFKAAKELEGLDPTMLEAVTVLENGYLTELTPMNDRLAETLRGWEPREERLRAEAFAQRMAGQQPGEIVDQTRDGFMTRDELGRSYVRQLRGILTDAQFAQLPGGYRWADMPGETKPQTPESGDGREPSKGEAPQPMPAQIPDGEPVKPDEPGR